VRECAYHNEAIYMKAKIQIELLLLTSKEKTPGTAPSRMEAEEAKTNSFMFGVGLLRSVL
jgi:hypothetical protein